MLPHIIGDTSCIVIDTSPTRYVTGIRFVHQFEHHSLPVNTSIVYKSVRYMSVVRKIGAGEGIRTLDPNLGKVVLYH